MSAGHHYMLQRRCEACFEVKKQTWLLNDRASSTSPLKVLYCTTDMSSRLFLLHRQGHHTSCYEGQLERERNWDYMWAFREGEGMVNKGQRERFNWNHSREALKDTVWVRGRGSETGGNTWQQKTHMVALTFKLHYPNVIWNMFSWVPTLFLCPQVYSP